MRFGLYFHPESCVENTLWVLGYERTEKRKKEKLRPLIRDGGDLDQEWYEWWC